MRRRLIAVLGTTACSVGLIVAVPPAQAAQAAPDAHLQLHTKTVVHAKAEQTFRYHATNLRPGTRVVLQAFEGTWETRATSGPKHGTANGTFTAPGPAGAFEETLRVVAVHHGSIYAKSAHKTVYVYGPVSLKNLCHGVLHKSVVKHGNTCTSGSEDAGHGTTFHYSLVTGESTPSEGYRPQFGADATSCRSISLHYVNDVGSSETIELRQVGAKAHAHTSNGTGIGSFASMLTGKKFGVSVAQDDNDLFTAFSGSASCYSYDGRP